MLGLRDCTATRGRVRVDVALCIFRIFHWPARTSIALGWKRPHLSTRLITPSPLRTKGVHPDPGIGKFTRRARASQCCNLTFLKRCPKLPEQANRHWRNCGPTEPLDGVTGRRICLNTRRQPTSPPCLIARHFKMLVQPSVTQLLNGVKQGLGQDVPLRRGVGCWLCGGGRLGWRR